MNDDFFADWTNLGADDDVDDPFNETQNVSQPAVPQAPPQQAPTMQQAAAYVPPAPQSIQNPVPQYPGMEPQHPAAPTAAVPAFSNAPAFGTAPSETGHGIPQAPAVAYNAPRGTQQFQAGAPTPASVSAVPASVPQPAAGTDLNPLQAAAEQADNLAAQSLARSLTELPPVFVYGDCEEDITDPKMTFEDLRLEKMSDFPEMEDFKKVKWVVKYGDVTKSIGKPKQESIAKVKAAIEISASFLTGLKKAKGKQPRCKIEPTVLTQNKGIAMYKGLFATPEEAMASEKVICVCPARDGRVYEVRKTRLGTFIVPQENILELSQISAGFQPALPLVPYLLFEQVISFFKFYAGQKSPLEALVNIYWDSEKERFIAVVPRQKVTGASIVTVGDNQMDTDRYIHYMDIHSHNRMHAFFSETDNADEKAARVYIVVGRLDKLQPEILARISCGGRFQTIEPETVIEMEQRNFPSHWRSSIVCKGGAVR